MALILNIETATDCCSVALSLDGKLVSLKEAVSGQSHARLLTEFVELSVKEAGYKLTDIDAFSVSKGPGSFTGLRIGVASAKGFCFGLDKPMIGINTLQSMATNFVMQNKIESGTWLCPMIDARRMEVYTAFFNENAEFTVDTAAEIIIPGIFDKILENRKVIFFGDGMEKSRQIIDNHNNAFFVPGNFASATGMIPLSEKSYTSGIFEDVSYFEPFYLKDFFTGRQPVNPS